jgi:hypothetical protein
LIITLVTLACGSEGSTTDLIQTSPTATPTPEPAFESIGPNFVLMLPQEVTSSTGSVFTIKRIELLESISSSGHSYAPRRGLYLWLIGTVSNSGDKRVCIRAQEFAVLAGAERYKMRVEEAEAIRQLSNLPYPDFYIGHCLDGGQAADSFLVFDVSREAADLWLELGDGKSRLGRTAALIAATPQPLVTSPHLEIREAAAPSPMVTAAGSNVNIRRGPGTGYDIVGRLPAGQSLEIVGRNADSSWWQVSLPTGYGWVAAKVTIASPVDERIPVR